MVLQLEPCWCKTVLIKLDVVVVFHVVVDAERHSHCCRLHITHAQLTKALPDIAP
jgi:hypothetical protein